MKETVRNHTKVEGGCLIRVEENNERGRNTLAVARQLTADIQKYKWMLQVRAL